MRLRWVVLGALALMAAGCEKAGPAVVVDVSQVEQQLYFSHALEGRRVSIDGYLSFDNGPNGEAIAMAPQLTTAPFGGGEKVAVPFQLEHGGGPNQLNLPVLNKKPIAETPMAVITVDIAKATFQDSAGVAHPLSEPVRLTGRLRYAYVQNYFQSDADPRSPTGRRYKPRLTKVVLTTPPAG